VTDQTTIGVIGGSGLYDLFAPGTAEERVVETPFGTPSSPVTIGEMAGRPVAFLTRHGRDHSVAPHRINHRANLWALRSLGVRALLTSSAVGGLHPDYAPGTFVVTDQLIDRTWGREQTFFDEGGVQHLSFADPFDPVLRAAAIAALGRLDVPLRTTGTCVVIQGPRFSTRAESRAHRADGGHTINMTLCPEVQLAAELGIGTVNLSYVTDADAGLSPDELAAGADGEEAVSHGSVMARLRAANDTIVRAIEAVVTDLPPDFAPRELVPAAASATVLDRAVHA
jgi:5'-methylthioadenosine phosphorylase